jgi:hypothetical protein
MRGDHPHTDPGDGRTECDTCGKWVWESIHSCKRVPVTPAALERMYRRNADLAAALRREAHELDYRIHEVVDGTAIIDIRARAEALRARADGLDGSGS